VPPAHVRELRQLLSQRRQLVETHTQIVNRRHSLAHRHHLKHDRGKRFNKKTTGSQKDKNLSALEQFQLESEGAFCLSQFTHKRTLPKNANQMKNTTKPNSFLARETIRGYTFDTNIHTPSARLALNRSGKDDFKFSLPANSVFNFILS